MSAVASLGSSLQPFHQEEKKTVQAQRRPSRQRSSRGKMQIDDDTWVPSDIGLSLLKGAEAARNQGVHCLVQKKMICKCGACQQDKEVRHVEHFGLPGEVDANGFRRRCRRGCGVTVRQCLVLAEP